MRRSPGPGAARPGLRSGHDLPHRRPLQPVRPEAHRGNRRTADPRPRSDPAARPHRQPRGRRADAPTPRSPPRRRPGEPARGAGRPRRARAPRKSGRSTSPPAPGAGRSTCSGTRTSPGPTRGRRSRSRSSRRRVAGPFDLGVVVVRSALYIDPADRAGHGQIRPDPDDPRRHPARCPLDRRRTSSRSHFTLNPTSCERMAITGLEASLARRGGAAVRPLPGRGLRGAAVQAERSRLSDASADEQSQRRQLRR